MPVLTRWFVKSALAYFVGALLLGVAVTLPAVLPAPPAVGALGPVYFHFFMVGWVAQLIFGVVYWMFPRYSKKHPRGSETLGWATYGLLNVGLLVRAVAEPLHALQPRHVAIEVEQAHDHELGERPAVHAGGGGEQQAAVDQAGAPQHLADAGAGGLHPA